MKKVLLVAAVLSFSAMGMLTGCDDEKSAETSKPATEQSSHQGHDHGTQGHEGHDHSTHGHEGHDHSGHNH